MKRVFAGADGRRPRMGGDAPALASARALTRLILIGTFILVSAFTLILIANFLVAKNYYVLPRIGVALVIFVYVSVAAWLYRRTLYRVVAVLLVIFYAVLGTAILSVWSIDAPVGILTLSFVIVLAGVMLGARLIIPTTASVIVIILALEIAERVGAIRPDYSSIAKHSTFTDVATYGTLFVIFAIVSWLSGRRMELALSRALKAESELALERDSLEVRLEEKTREVKEAQMEEMSALYRFAELGQLGTALLHDLSNNLTALTLDIDEVDERSAGRSADEAVARAKESIGYLENVIGSARRRLGESDKPVRFDARFAILETIGNLGAKARRSGVNVEYEPGGREPFLTVGDPIRFAHVLTILISNGIDAYEGSAHTMAPSVLIGAAVKHGRLVIGVTDHGKGITAAERSRLFKPFASTKPNGMGIGLFMAREMAERHFNGTLTLSPNRDETTFLFTVPRAKGKSNA